MALPHRVGGGLTFSDPSAIFGTFPAPPPPYSPPSEVTDAWREYVEGVRGAVPYNVGRARRAVRQIPRTVR